MVYDHRLWVSRCEFGENILRIVRAIVVNEDNFIFTTNLLKRFRQTLVHDGHGGGIAVAGYDGTDFFARCGIHFREED